MAWFLSETYGTNMYLEDVKGFKKISQKILQVLHLKRDATSLRKGAEYRKWWKQNRTKSQTEQAMKKKDFQEALKTAGYMHLTLTFYKEIVP